MVSGLVKTIQGTSLLVWSVLALLIPTAAFTIPAVVERSSSYKIDCCQLSRNLILHAAGTTTEEFNENLHQRNIIVLCHKVSQDVVDGIFDVNNLPKGRIDVLARCVTSALWMSNRIRTDTTVYLMLSPHNITIEVQGSGVRSLTPDERTIALYLQRTLWNGKEKSEGEQETSNDMVDSNYSYSSSTNTKNSQTQNSTYMNPQSAPMSKGKMLRDRRKERDAMIHRIRIAHQGKSSLPGFMLHYNDTLKSRLHQLVRLSSGDDTTDDDASNIYMLSESGDPLWDVLEDRQHKKSKRATINSNNGQNRKTTTATTTTLILGNQLGYSVDDEKLLLGSPIVQEVSLGALSLLTSQCITITQHYLDRFELK